MTDDSNDTLSWQKLAQSGAKKRSSHRLDGPEALLTGEWNIEDLPWLSSADGLQTLGSADTEPASDRHLPPPPPSRRRRDMQATAVAGDRTTSAVTSAVGGAAAAAGTDARPPPRLITVPKKPRSELDAAPARVVLNPPDFGATLPPLAEREAFPGERQELPSFERDAEPTAEERSDRSRRRHRPIAAVATVVCVAITYAVSSGLIHSKSTAESETPPMPEFLRPPPVAASVGTAPAAAFPIASPAALPPGLAATLAEALPHSSTPAETALPVPAAGTASESAPPGAQVADPPEPRAPVSATGTIAPPRGAVEVDAELSKALSPAPPPKRPAPASETRPRLSTPARALPPPGTHDAPRGTAPVAKSDAREFGGPTRPSVSTADPLRLIRPLTTYTYGDKALFTVATAPMRVTDLVLEPGEKLVSQPTAGDSARWVISVLDSVVQGQPQQHVFVKPLRAGLRTNLTLTTDRRSYFLELGSRDEGAYMAGVQWQYPLDAADRRREELAQAEHERQSTTQVSDLDALRFDYRIEVTTGHPDWTPTMVFDDGQKTFIRFPRPISPSSAPLVFVLRSGNAKDAKFVNYRIKNDLYVIDRLIDAAELRLASTAKSRANTDTSTSRQDVVRITRK